MADQSNAPLESPVSMGPMSPFDIEAQQAAIKRAIFAKMLGESMQPISTTSLGNGMPTSALEQLSGRMLQSSQAVPGLEQTGATMLDIAKRQRDMMQSGADLFGQGAQVTGGEMGGDGMGPPTPTLLPDYTKMQRGIQAMQTAGMTDRQVQAQTAPLLERMGIQLGQHPELLIPDMGGGKEGGVSLSNNPALISAAARSKLPGPAGEIAQAQLKQLQEESKVQTLKPDESLLLGQKVITRMANGDFNIFDTKSGLVTRATGADAAQKATAAAKATGAAEGETLTVPQVGPDGTTRNVVVKKSSMLKDSEFNAATPAKPAALSRGEILANEYMDGVKAGKVDPALAKEVSQLSTKDKADFEGAFTKMATTAAPAAGPPGVGATTAQEEAAKARITGAQATTTGSAEDIRNSWQTMKNLPDSLKYIRTGMHAINDGSYGGSGKLMEYVKASVSALAAVNGAPQELLTRLNNANLQDATVRAAMLNELKGLGSRFSNNEMGSIVQSLGGSELQPEVAFKMMSLADSSVRRQMAVHNELVTKFSAAHPEQAKDILPKYVTVPDELTKSEFVKKKAK